MSSLGNREKQLLLDLARRAIIVAAERRESLESLPQDFQIGESFGAFVTLRKRGRLRGCIGQIGSGQSLIEVVAHCAKSAALEDPRFEPVRADELREIEIELSVLSPLEEIVPDRIEVGKHGLMVSRGSSGAPAAAGGDRNATGTPGRFLEETCVKAGLERDAWREPETKIHGFSAEVFAESEFRTGRIAQPQGPGKASLLDFDVVARKDLTQS